MVGHAQENSYRYCHSKREKMERNKESLALRNSEKQPGKFHQVLKPGNNPQWLQASQSALKAQSQNYPSFIMKGSMWLQLSISFFLALEFWEPLSFGLLSVPFSPSWYSFCSYKILESLVDLLWKFTPLEKRLQQTELTDQE